ncbi:MAG: hypothetical protein ABJQ70_06580 [Roseobacter sp.]
MKKVFQSHWNGTNEDWGTCDQKASGETAAIKRCNGELTWLSKTYEYEGFWYVDFHCNSE